MPQTCSRRSSLLHRPPEGQTAPRLSTAPHAWAQPLTAPNTFIKGNKDRTMQMSPLSAPIWKAGSVGGRLTRHGGDGRAEPRGGRERAGEGVMLVSP